MNHGGLRATKAFRGSLAASPPGHKSVSAKDHPDLVEQVKNQLGQHVNVRGSLLQFQMEMANTVPIAGQPVESSPRRERPSQISVSAFPTLGAGDPLSHIGSLSTPSWSSGRNEPDKQNSNGQQPHRLGGNARFSGLAKLRGGLDKAILESAAIPESARSSVCSDAMVILNSNSTPSAPPSGLPFGAPARYIPLQKCPTCKAGPNVCNKRGKEGHLTLTE